MDAMQVLAHQAAMGYRDTLGQALPGAPRRPDRRPAIRVRLRLAYSLRWTADRLDPACRAA
ncbi:hypothetical protein FAF44_24670 [Nonomuraea sp. MG754425]|uniref:hypothetical protein n=1 Tax=Nonomuraea sp. MG754425 TaxID=2570319 RepID=UPI001F1EB4F0|nr:hypothetical protein [Nonomuraea sp. MG754425]MCF6471562.1 hypothetical protein [Nonomuraea sp. MG754425]